MSAREHTKSTTRRLSAQTAIPSSITTRDLAARPARPSRRARRLCLSIAEHGLDELVNKKHEGGGVIYGLRVVKLIEYTRDERKAILYLTKKIDDDTLIDRRLDELEELERTGRMQPFVLLYVGQTVCVLVRRR